MIPLAAYGNFETHISGSMYLEISVSLGAASSDLTEAVPRPSAAAAARAALIRRRQGPLRRPQSAEWTAASAGAYSADEEL